MRHGRAAHLGERGASAPLFATVPRTRGPGGQGADAPRFALVRRPYTRGITQLGDVGGGGWIGLYTGYNPADTWGVIPHAQGGNRMPVITALNQKGGVGKTSTCYHLAGTLAQSGRRVLLVDNDPQASLTQGFLGPQVTRQLDPAETIAAVYQQEAVPDQVLRADRDPERRSPGRQPARRELQRPRPAPGRLAAPDGPARLPGRRPRPIRHR